MQPLAPFSAGSLSARVSRPEDSATVHWGELEYAKSSSTISVPSIARHCLRKHRLK